MMCETFNSFVFQCEDILVNGTGRSVYADRTKVITAKSLPQKNHIICSFNVLEIFGWYLIDADDLAFRG
jgi:hypothetical protein